MEIDQEKQPMADSSAPRRPSQITVHRLWVLGAALFLCAALALRWGSDIWYLLRNEAALEEFLATLGWLGPVGLILFNAIQIVVAPVPGYVVQIASGYLFGPFWGGVWASIGLLVGATLSMWIVRQFGRPLAEWLIGAERLARWEHVTHTDSVWTWLILIVTPTGDIPYFLAGLSHVKFRTIFLLTLLIRVPTTFVAAAVGAGALALNWWQFALLLAVLIGVLILFVRYQDLLTGAIDNQVTQRLARQEHPAE
jgi:uncharacterized membrane protein YdjX (TVP38/TMEM64 family)